MMKFVVTVTRSSGCRRAVISELSCHPKKTIETPVCLLYTRGGNTPHLTPDLLESLQHLPSAVHMPMPSLVEHHEVIEEYKEGLAKFTAMQGNVLFTTVQDSATEVPTGYNDRTSVAVWGKGGKSKMDADLYMKVQEAFCPDFYQALSDGDTAKDSTRKRIRKSVDRTLQFLDQCLEKHMKSQRLNDSCVLGAVEGGYDIKERLRSARETATRPVHGFILEGFHSYGLKSEKLDFSEIRELVNKTVGVLPEGKPRLMQGLWTPDTVLEAVNCGIDLFDSSYPYVVTERGEALVFHYDYNKMVSPEGLHENGEVDMETATDAVVTDTNCSKFTINLKNKRYFEDFSPISPSCQCYACENFTRSYIHHLLNTSELLASVLLMLHNFHHYFGYFHTIRSAISDNKFDDLQKLVWRQKLDTNR